MKKLLDKNSGHKTLCMMAELPCGAEKLPEDNVDGSCFVIDKRNCESVLGISPADVGDTVGKGPCLHKCTNKAKCWHPCCKR